MTKPHQPPSTDEFIDLLSEKDDMILTLTARLEETADQLDRLQRMGVDRLHGSDSGGGGGAEQRVLHTRLGAMLDLVEDVQPVEKLDRIEQGVDSILRLLEQRFSFAEAAPRDAEQRSTENRAAEKPDSAPARKEENPAPVGEDFWEQTKARLMGQTVDSGSTVAGPQSTAPESGTSRPETSPALPSDASNDSGPGHIPPIEPPEQIDIDATPEMLQKGIEERDRYIQYMICRLRQAEQTCFPQDWKELAAAPEDLKAAVEDLRDKLQNQLRRAELANAIERAALGRERAKLFQVKQQLEQQIRKLGKAGPSDTPNVTDRLKAMLGRS